MKTIRIAKEFTKYPAGRHKYDGPYSGEKFRDEFIVPLIDKGERFKIDLDGTAGYGSSFLEEAFGGLVRKGYNPDSLKSLMVIHTKDKSLELEIKHYIEHGRVGLD